MRLLYGIIIILGFQGCNKEVENNTKLELTVLDQNGRPAEGINVKLFKYFVQYIENVSEISKGITNEKGIVTFSNLDTIMYYFSPINGCLNNYLEEIRSIVLKEGITNTITTRLHQTAKVSIINNTTNTYIISFNGISILYIGSKEKSVTRNIMPTGKVNVRVEQQNFSMFPNDTTFIIEAECNSNESIVIQ